MDKREELFGEGQVYVKAVVDKNSTRIHVAHAYNVAPDLVVWEARDLLRRIGGDEFSDLVKLGWPGVDRLSFGVSDDGIIMATYEIHHGEMPDGEYTNQGEDYGKWIADRLMRGRIHS